MGLVANSGILSTLSTSASTQITDKVDSPHAGLFKGLHVMNQGSYGIKDAATLGLAHTFSDSGSDVQVAISAGKGFYNGKYVSINALTATTLTPPASGSFYHWAVYNDADPATITIIAGSSDGVVPDITLGLIPISLMRIQSTTEASTMSVQYFTTNQYKNSVSLGYKHGSGYYVDAGNITGTSTGIKLSGPTEVEQSATGGQSAFKIDNDDTDQIALEIEAANITGDVIQITANAVTTVNVMDISATGLTDGTILNTASTSTVTDGGTSKIISSAITNDGVGSQTAKGILLDYNKTGITASGKTANVSGLHIDMDDSVTNVGTVTMTGLDIDANFANTGGTVKNIGLDVAVAGADTNYAALFSGGNVGIGTTAPNSQLEVRGPTGTGTASAGVLTLSTAELSVENNDQLGRIDFQAPLESSGTDAILVAASIWAEADTTFNSSNNHTELVFATASSEAATEKMRLTKDGLLGIGTSEGISAPLHVQYTGNGNGIILESTETGTSNAPDLVLYRNPLDGSGDKEDPSDDDELGVILFRGKNDHASGASSNQDVDYAYIAARTTDVTDSSEEAALKFGIYSGGSPYTLARLGKPNVDSNATVHAGWHTRAAIASVGAATYSPDIASSGIVILMTNSSSIVTLPDVAAADIGVQYTIINNSGGALSGKIVSADTSNTRFNGAGSYAAQDIADDKAKTFLCTAADNWQVIG